MDDLFDLNDYEEKPEISEEIKENKIVAEEVVTLNTPLSKNLYQIEKSNLEKIITTEKIIITVPTEGSNPETNPHDDSFEAKITINTTKNLITGNNLKSSCTHAVDDTIDIKEFDKISDLALSFPFELDIFQKRSIIRLEQHQNVLVCAHTSSGKTVVAEYAIALGKKNSKRVFYTSPIKALSNQKYREFKGKFGDVGILTGDVSINPEAQCVIMTTEILQASLYKNSEMLNLVDWVVFDEVHYINDNERGHVWEEILILLPPRIGIVMLSATVPNYLDFAKWVGRIKNTTIYIQNTLKRVVPLEHKIFIATKKVYLVKDKTEKVLEVNINLAMKELEAVNNKEYQNKSNPKMKKEREVNEAKKLDQVRNFYRGLEKKEKDNFNKERNNNRGNNTGGGNNNHNYNQGGNNNNFNKGGNYNSGSNNSGNQFTNNQGNKNPFNQFRNSNQNNNNYNNSYNNSNYNSNAINSTPHNNSIPSRNNPPNYKQNRYTMTHMKLEEMVRFLFDAELTPAVIFVFSIKKIDEYSRLLAIESRVSKSESSQIISFFDRCMSKLSAEDKLIPQVQLMRRILPQGIGVHHAGLLPVLKETIEILYSKGLIKILFATTSFSIGLNMPTRTVVFTDVEKYNDERKEILSSSEYLQMCGRAGRRGLDAIGHIFLLMGDKKNPPQVSELAQMVGGKGTHVESKFRLSYRTIISFLSRNIKNIMEFFKESYLENNKILIMPETMKEVEEIKDKLMKVEQIQCKFNDGDDFVRNFYQDGVKLEATRKKMFGNALIFSRLNQGRVIKVKSKSEDKEVYAVILYYYKDYEQFRCLTARADSGVKIEYEKDNKNNNGNNSTTNTISNPLNEGVLNKIFFQYFEVELHEIIEITDNSIKIDKTMTHFDNDDFIFVKQKEMDKVLNSILEQSNRTPKILDYLKASNNDIEVFEQLNMKNQMQKNISESKCHDCVHKTEHLKLFKERQALENKFHEKSSMLSSENLKYYNDFKSRVAVLKSLGYIDEDDQILLKGKAARELATSDCVLISELLMGNILDKLDVAETVAFISGFAYSKNEIDCEDPMISENFSVAVRDFTALLEGLFKLEESLGFEESKYNRRITFVVSKSIHLWMHGHKFKDILGDSDLEEGKLYNLIMRLYLFLEEIKNFAGVIGNTKLAEKFQLAKDSIMRDILSCRSLYLQEDIDIDN